MATLIEELYIKAHQGHTLPMLEARSMSNVCWWVEPLGQDNLMFKEIEECLVPRHCLREAALINILLFLLISEKLLRVTCSQVYLMLLAMWLD